MDWDEIKAHWQAYRGNVARRWPQISDRELDRIDGDRQRLSQYIQDVYRVSAEEANRQIAQWSDEQNAAHREPYRGDQVDAASHDERVPLPSGARREPGVSEDDAVSGKGGNPLPSEEPCHLGYMDDEDERELAEGDRPGVPDTPGGDPTDEIRNRDSSKQQDRNSPPKQ